MSSKDLVLSPPIAPMLALPSARIPEGEGWLYEPKWDGFRTLVFWDGRELFPQSLQPVTRSAAQPPKE